MKVKKKKLRLKNKYFLFLKYVFLLFFVIILVQTTRQTLLWEEDNNETKNIEEEIQKIVEIQEVKSNEEEELVNIPDDKDDIYWKYQDVSLIDVDINKLKTENDDTIGWIQVLGTNINYPFVQSNDNEYYLSRDFTKKKNTGGWIFLDYRNNINNLSKNNIIYGHRRYNKSMFGTLKNVLTSDWQQNTDNHIIKVATKEYNYLFQVFSVYSITNETYYLQTDFANASDYLGFLKTIVERSEYNFNTEVNEDTQILTLSTCHNKEDRLVVHSKLIKINKK